jgi:hypothetical protein
MIREKIPDHYKMVVGKDSTSKWALPKSGSEREYTWDPWGRTGVTHDNCYDYAFGSFSNNRVVKSVPGASKNIPSNNLTFRTCDGIVKRVLADNPGKVFHMKNPNARARPGFFKVMCFVAPTNDFGNATGDFHWYVQMGSIRYKTVPGDTVEGLAKLFHVKPEVIRKAALRTRRPLTNSDGKISTNNTNIKRPVVKVGTRMTAGRIIRFPANLWAHKQGHASGPLLVDASGKTIVDPRRSDRKWHPGFHYTKFCAAYEVQRGAVRTGNNNNGNNIKNVNSPQKVAVRNAKNVARQVSQNNFRQFARG